MIPNTKSIFRDLEPPPGGEARLRHALARLHSSTASPTRAQWIGAVGAGAALALVLAIGVRPSGPDPDDRVGDAVRTVLAAPEDRFQARAARVVESHEGTGSVRLYVLMPARQTANSGG